MKLSLTEIAKIVGGKILGGDVQVNGLSTDTRNMLDGKLFIALVGETFDPHELIEKGKANHADAVLVQRQVSTDIPQVIVDDSYQALQKIALTWREKFNIPVIGVTGSNGKTSVKELVKQILSTQGKVLATVGNLNNHIGVPLTLCNLDVDHQYAVIEMGANHVGEIATLAKMAKPQYWCDYKYRSCTS